MNIAPPLPRPFEGARTARDDARSVLLDRFTAAGYARIEPPILHEAAIFLDLGGEDIRAHLLLTADGAGTELCLRPEYTIPAARAYLASPHAGRDAAYCYCGPVFRSRPDATPEFIQAGLESFGRADTAAADAEVLALTLEALDAAGIRGPRVAVGDAGLFSRVLDALRLPPLWQRRLKRGLEKGATLDAILAGAPARADGRPGVPAAFQGADPRDARALVEDLLSIAGISAVGGRTVGEIAERFLSRAADGGAPGFAGERRALLERFLGVAGDPDSASTALRGLAAEAGLDLAEHLDLFDERTGFIAAHGVELENLAFSAAFGRNLDYYTGFVFEVRARREDGAGALLAGGGRYDRLATALDDRVAPVPAVGASIWVERLERAVRA